MAVAKRLRMFAGPNGSGKSTIYDTVKNKYDLGIYVNADDIEIKLNQDKFIKLLDYKLEGDGKDFPAFLNNHGLYNYARKNGYEVDLSLDEGRIVTSKSKSNSYEAAILADYLRTMLVLNGKSLTFETVMSHRSKIEFLKFAQKNGYRNYLYFVSTDSPEINRKRVETRVKKGGHPVPVDKIESRYYKSLGNLKEATRHCYRSFLFDNSEAEFNLILELLQHKSAYWHTDEINVWVNDIFEDYL